MSDKSKCLAVEGQFRQFIKGKNPTNLKVHFRRAHKEANLSYLNKLKDNAKPPSPDTEADPGTGLGSMMETTIGQRTLPQCFHRRTDGCWLVNSQKHHKQEEALVNMLIQKTKTNTKTNKNLK